MRSIVGLMGVFCVSGCFPLAPPPAPAAALGPIADVQGAVGELQLSALTGIPGLGGAYLQALPGTDAVVLDLRGEGSLGWASFTPGVWLRTDHFAVRLGAAVGEGTLDGAGMDAPFAPGFTGGSLHLQAGWRTNGPVNGALTLGGGGAYPFQGDLRALGLEDWYVFPSLWGSLDWSVSMQQGRMARFVFQPGCVVWYATYDGSPPAPLLRLALGVRLGKIAKPRPSVTPAR